MDIVGVLFTAGAAAFMLSSRPLRTVRTYLFLLVFALALLGSPFVLPSWWAFLVRAVAIWTYVVTVVWFEHLLIGRPRAELAFDHRLHEVTKQAGRAVSDWHRAAQAGDRSAMEAARLRAAASAEKTVALLDAMVPPTDAWRAALEQVRRYHESTAAYASTADETAMAEGTSDPLALTELSRAATRAWESAQRGARRT